jgi:hypothetical protein
LERYGNISVEEKEEEEEEDVKKMKKMLYQLCMSKLKYSAKPNIFLDFGVD